MFWEQPGAEIPDNGKEFWILEMRKNGHTEEIAEKWIWQLAWILFYVYWIEKGGFC